MNATQQLITKSFTIGHARQTVENLMDNIDEIIKNNEVDAYTLKKVQRIFNSLAYLIEDIKNTEYIINNIDN